MNGVPIKHIARLNAEGTQDTGFRTAITQTSAIYSFTLLPDGKIVVSGRATRYNDVLQPSLFRLRTDGSLDETFRSNFGITWDTIAYNVARREDGKLVVNAFFPKGPGIARVTAEGLVDTTFAPSGIADVLVNRFAMPSDNTLLLGVPGKLLRLTALQSQRITFAAISDKVTTDPPFELNATASSGLPVAYAVLSGPATVTGNTVSLTGTPGSVTIRAAQVGNAAYAAARDAEVTFRVEAVLGVEDADAGINLYPNPAQGGFWIEAPTRIAESDVHLYDA